MIDARSSDRLILASASPRRRELLARVGLDVEVRPVDVDESTGAGEPPQEAVVRLARAKAAAARERFPARAILAADTVVVLEGELLGKPADRAEARAMLGALAGRWHEVLTALVLVTADGTMHSAVARTRVRFAALDDAEIEAYVAGEEPYDKAGGYALQGAAGWFIEEIDGSASNVIGLPYEQLRRLLARAALPRPNLRGGN